MNKIGLIGLSAIALTVAGCGGPSAKEESKYKIVCSDGQTYYVSSIVQVDHSGGWLVIFENGRTIYRHDGTCIRTRTK